MGGNSGKQPKEFTKEESDQHTNNIKLILQDMDIKIKLKCNQVEGELNKR